MILVTGATGLVGGNLLWYLLQENDRVTAIRRTTSNLEPLRTIFSFYTAQADDFLSRIDWKISDVLDPVSIMDAMRGVTVVYHCAAVVSFADKADILLDTNVRGTHNVVEAALETGVEKLCFVSSIAACGKSGRGEKIDENSVWTEHQHNSPYSLSKYYSEQEVWKGIERGLPAVIVNPGVILGVSGTDTGSSQLFSQVRKGLLFYTNGGSGYVDVRDVAKAMITLMKSDIEGERFVLVGENCSNKDVLGWMADGFGKRRPIFCVGKKALWIVGSISEFLGKVFHFTPLINRGTARTATNREYYSSSKIESTFHFSFTPIVTCIQKICSFYSKK